MKENQLGRNPIIDLSHDMHLAGGEEPCIRKRPLFMGILNVTPNSFSDGGRFVTDDGAGHVTRFELDKLVEHMFKLVHDGADIIDLGGMSTAPGTSEISVGEELHRITSVLPTLVEAAERPISIDTYRAEVADAACHLGATIINDISGGTFDSDMADVASRHGVAVCLGHIQGTPETMQNEPRYDNVVEEVFQSLKSSRDSFVAAGVDPAAICLDPGIGFGKNLRQNISLIRHMNRFLELDQPILVGHSRKRLIKELAQQLIKLGTPGELSLLEDSISIRIARALVRGGAHILRVHDVELHASVALGDER